MILRWKRTFVLCVYVTLLIYWIVYLSSMVFMVFSANLKNIMLIRSMLLLLLDSNFISCLCLCSFFFELERLGILYCNLFRVKMSFYALKGCHVLCLIFNPQRRVCLIARTKLFMSGIWFEIDKWFKDKKHLTRGSSGTLWLCPFDKGCRICRSWLCTQLSSNL